jgi:lysophospholipase L1-like esterase
MRVSLLVFVFSLLAGLASADDLQRIAPTDPGIVVIGAHYATPCAEGLELLRFSPETYAIPFFKLKANATRARTTSGVRLRFRTDAARAVLTFVVRAGDEDRGAQFGIYRDGVWVKEMSAPKGESPRLVELVNPEPGQPVTFDVVLPSWSNPIFSSLDISSDAKLLPPPPSDRKIYVALGDSISHGTGQRSASFQTWPFLLSQKIDYDFYNLAVGGAQISLPIGELLKDWPRVDLVTILIGYNDWNSGVTEADFKTNLDALVGTVRQSHPEARIVCIRPLFTRSTAPKHGDVTLDALRDAVTAVVANRVDTGDKNLFVLNGDAFTSEANLSTSSDPVHLSIPGAAKFADELAVRISALK